MLRSSLPLLTFVALALAPAPAPAAVYVTADPSDQITAFDRGPQDGPGALAPLGPALPAGDEPLGVAVSPDGDHVYVASRGSDSVSAYAAAAGGQLTPLAAPPPATGDAPSGIAVSPDGSLLFTADAGGTASAFTITADGTPAAVAGSPFAVGGSPAGIAVSPDGANLYVTDRVANKVAAFTITADGSLTPVATYPAGGTEPIAIAITPDGSRLYVANAISDTISRFAVGAGGTLGTASAQPAGGAPVSIAITPGGSRLVAGLRDDSRIAAFSIGPAGSLLPVAGSPFATVTAPAALAVAPGGSNVYATATGGPEVAAHSLSPSGALGSVAGSPFPDGSAGHGSGSVAITPEQAPQASFSFAEPTQRDLVVDFDASASADPDGEIASYSWDFGDGTSATRSDPAAPHVYESPGRYTATLSVLDAAGCGSDVVFTGQTAFCNGGPGAIASAEVIVSEPAVLNPFLEVRRTQLQGGKVKVRAQAGAGEPVEAEARGKIRIPGSKRVIRLRRARAAIEGSDRKMLRLRPKTSAGARQAERLLKEGAGLRAKVRVTFTDVPGNTAYERAKARLVPKR